MKPTFWRLMRLELGYRLESKPWFHKWILNYSHTSPNGEYVYLNKLNGHMVCLDHKLGEKGADT